MVKPPALAGVFSPMGTAEVFVLAVRGQPLLRGSKCIAILGHSNGGIATVHSGAHSRSSVLSTEGLFSEVLLYMQGFSVLHFTM